MYGFHQSLNGKIESTDAYSLETDFRELKEKIDFRIYLHSFKTKWLGHNEKYSCNIYIIELDLEEKP